MDLTKFITLILIRHLIKTKLILIKISQNADFCVHFLVVLILKILGQMRI